MPAKYTVRFERPKEIKAAPFNAMVRECLLASAIHWLKHFQMLHFEPGAAQRYQMAARSEGYRRRRAALAKSRGETPANLVFSGKARDLARMRQQNPMMVNTKARATASKQYVSVPLTIGHPINPTMKHSDGTNDFGRLARDEILVMIRVAKGEMETRFLAWFRVKHTTTIGVAA